MSGQTNRREFLGAALGGAALCAIPSVSMAQESAALTAETLADNLLWIRGAGGNVLAAAGAEGLALVDGGSRARSAELLDFARRETGESAIPLLFNTHWHPEQTGSNVALGEAGAQIVAHENTRLWLSHDFYVRWQDREYAALPEAGQPDRTFYETLDVEFDGGVIAAGYMPQAHTDGDIYVRFPEANVIASGGVGSTDGWPVFDWGTGGWIIGQMDGLDALLALADEDTKILPATGGLVTRAEIAEQRVMYETIQQRIFRQLRRGLSLEEVLLENPAAEFEAQWGDAAQFLALTYQGMVMQMRGHRMRIA